MPGAVKQNKDREMTKAGQARLQGVSSEGKRKGMEGACRCLLIMLKGRGMAGAAWAWGRNVFQASKGRRGHGRESKTWDFSLAFLQ